MQISSNQIAQVNQQIQALLNANNFYGKKLKEAGVSSIQSAEDFENLPFSEKNDLRNAYPLGLMTAPEEKIVRIHSSSGTTGLPVIIPYTAKDVDDWAIMFKRCYEMAGMTNMDRIQITPGYDCGLPESVQPALKNWALWSFLWDPGTQTNSFR